MTTCRHIAYPFSDAKIIINKQINNLMVLILAKRIVYDCLILLFICIFACKLTNFISMVVKDGKYCRFLVSLISDGKVLRNIWCSDSLEVDNVKKRFSGIYEIEIRDLTWSDFASGFRKYQEARRKAIEEGCDLFCTDGLFGTHGIVEMRKRTGDTFYGIRRSIERGWKSLNGHNYERLKPKEDDER